MSRKIHPVIKEMSEGKKNNLLNRLLGKAMKAHMAKNNSTCWLYGVEIITALLRFILIDVPPVGKISISPEMFEKNCGNYIRRQIRAGNVINPSE